MISEGDREALGNRTQLRAIVCSRMTQQAQTPAHIVSCWSELTFWVAAIHKGKQKQSVAAQSTRALFVFGVALCYDDDCFYYYKK